jgi:hypothetical protein
MNRSSFSLGSVLALTLAVQILRTVMTVFSSDEGSVRVIGMYFYDALMLIGLTIAFIYWLRKYK